MPTILGANTLSTGYNVANSLRFNDDSSDSLSKSFGTPSSTTTWTISFWVKKCTNGSALNLSSQGVGTSNEDRIRFTSGDALEWSVYKSSYKGRLVTNRLFRDNSAWYNIVCVWDTTNGTAGDRMRIYVNGVEETSFSTDTNPDQNETSNFNTSATNYIGSVGSGEFFDGYMTEVVFLDGTAVSNATSFGEFDEDSPTIWKPIDVSGLTFGNNGFYLDFEDSGSLGNDKAGSNNFTVNNLTAADQSTDTCTNNFATLNPLNRRLTSNDPTYSEGNLKLTGQTGNAQNNNAIATIGDLQSGKWYFEVKCTTDGDNFGVGISDNPVGTNGNAASDTYYVTYNKSGEIVYGTGSSATTASYGNSYTDGDIIGVAFDLDNGALYFYKNGSIQNSGTAARTDLLTQMADGYTPIGFTNKGVMEFNFGGTQSFTISSGNADGRNRGNFEYSVPSGYFSVNTKNLAEFG